MIKAAGKTTDGRTLLIFGISEENIARLRRGEPVFVDGRDVGQPDICVTIFAGKTEETMMMDLKSRGFFLEERSS